MNENLKTTITQKLEDMTDETARQLLDYMEFLESKFNRSTRERSTLERIAENVEGTLRSSRIGEAAVKGTGGLIDAAGTVARSMAAAGQAALDELQSVVTEESEETEEEAEKKPTDESTDDGGSSTDDSAAAEKKAAETAAGGESESA
jgi:hypothetical protein